MRAVLINPNWSYDGSIYFGCRKPHLPLEFGYTAALLHRQGHQALIVDGHLLDLSEAEIRARAAAFEPDIVVVATAPTYLFWRCPPPELRVPQSLLKALKEVDGIRIAVGPHGSATPASTLRKLDVDAVVLGECEEVIPGFADPDWLTIRHIAYRDAGGIRIQGPPASATFFDLPPLQWPAEWIMRHRHHHHRFDEEPLGPGAEMEASRGCPYACTFCAKENFRSLYRKRPLSVLLRELDGLLEQGVEYVYFIDEIFLPDPILLEVLKDRRVGFGIQTRIDLWTPEMLERLGKAGCKSIEAGVESLTPEGRHRMGKPGRLSTEEISERLEYARRYVPFVQANLVAAGDDPEQVSAWRDDLRARGVWANDPVPLFPYPGAPEYRNLFGPPDESAWERAHAWYLHRFNRLSDLQAPIPASLAALETAGGLHA